MSNEITNETADQYHANPALSWSKLKVFMASPARYKAEFIDRTRTRDETPALEQGRLMHLAVLEPERFDAEVAIGPDVKLNTKAGKAAWYEFETANPGKTLRRAGPGAEVLAVRNAVANTPAAAVLAPARKEVTYRVETEYGPLQCRLDTLDADRNVIDLKTCDDITKAENQLWTFRYHLQEAFYRITAAYAGTYINRWQFLFQEKKPPFEQAMMEVGPEVQELAKIKVFDVLTRFAQCRTEDEWPTRYPKTDTVTVTPPKWVEYDLEQTPDSTMRGMALLAAFETGGDL